MSQYELIEGDCLVEMGKIADGSVDLILADLPYGTTACAWDMVIPFAPLWSHYKRIIKPRGAIVLFGAEPFSSVLQVSNLEWFKYRWVWKKNRPGDIFNAKNKPMRDHEDILVFSNGTTANCSDNKMTYNPQGLKYSPIITKNCYRKDGGAFKNKRPSHPEYTLTEYTNYPTSVIDIPTGESPFHPTQKPVDLLAYLIRTYTNEGETVLDNCMGSGSTGVAAMQTGRRFIGIELDENYFNIAKKRIEDAARAAQGLPKQLSGHVDDYADSPLFAEVAA